MRAIPQPCVPSRSVARSFAKFLERIQEREHGVLAVTLQVKPKRLVPLREVRGCSRETLPGWVSWWCARC